MDSKAYVAKTCALGAYECIKSRRRPICDVEVGARSVAVRHLGNLADWHKWKLKWNRQKWEFVDDPQANGWRDVARRDEYQLPTSAANVRYALCLILFTFGARCPRPACRNWRFSPGEQL
jgi:hypothetical protein